MNLGYACINMTLSESKPKITTKDPMFKKTYQQKGLEYAGELGMLNARDLSHIIKWNIRNGVNIFRISSDMFPWASEYSFTDLPQYLRIKLC